MRRLFFSLLVVSSCNRPASTTATTSPPPTASSATTEVSNTEEDPLQPLLEALPREVQAHEATMAHPGYRALLAPVEDILQQRFSGIPPDQVQLQIVPLLGQARTVLLFSPEKKARPILAAFDEQRSLAWFKDRPIHDLDPGISQFALCPGPEGEVFLVFHDPPTGMIAARRWDSTGGLLADFQLGVAGTIDHLAALYWPERGWLIAFSVGGTVKVQFLEERGRLAWGNEGRTLATNVLSGPIHLVLDTPVSTHVVWPGVGSTGRHYFDLRIDMEGRPLWKIPVDLGDASEQGIPRLERTSMAQIRAYLPGKSNKYIVDITAEGRVLIQ